MADQSVAADAPPDLIRHIHPPVSPTAFYDLHHSHQRYCLIQSHPPSGYYTIRSSYRCLSGCNADSSVTSGVELRFSWVSGSQAGSWRHSKAGCYSDRGCKGRQMAGVSVVCRSRYWSEGKNLDVCMYNGRFPLARSLIKWLALKGDFANLAMGISFAKHATHDTPGKDQVHHV